MGERTRGRREGRGGLRAGDKDGRSELCTERRRSAVDTRVSTGGEEDGHSGKKDTERKRGERKGG